MDLGKGQNRPYLSQKRLFGKNLTRNSSFWRWRNVNAWFKELESYEDPRYIKAYKIKI